MIQVQTGVRGGGNRGWNISTDWEGWRGERGKVDGVLFIKLSHDMTKYKESFVLSINMFNKACLIILLPNSFYTISYIQQHSGKVLYDRITL